ncbi:hypothetical protein BN7_4356 [Wickerhamomyces ciferrii]|uniref:GTPase n=1 Tax=Wickerhamomyces ciferrii (strain ATCC 14091 / BCRC 22168 / CBS 111 / JCM 3599 / NBRC 0793 / NRRL Y-1031 F-60-10) TaxID=1206466 RepID=K0KUC0_WICCF|nr:uncharacterized protein BN7_4356 [Wickerhamomyces ciferrii]CCH44788.1 hypothetical protein BN7_4356 [Wickerhamomyces ciferrii]
MLPRLIGKRGFCSTFPKYNVFTPKDNVPGLEANEEWLNNLNNSTDDDINNSSTLENPMVRRLTKNFDPSHNLKNNDTKFHNEGLDEKGFFNVKIPMNTYLTRSSPFSHLSSKQRPKAENQEFSDLRVIKLKTGKGGDGGNSFLRDANRTKGPPDGGDGGNGGSIYVRAVEGLTTLGKLRQSYIAGDGGQGKKNQLDGSTGRDIVLNVPVGTIIRWIPDPSFFKQAQLEGNENVEVEVKCTGSDGRPGEHNEFDKPKFIQLYRNSWNRGEGWIFKDNDKDEEYHRSKDYFRKLNRSVIKYDSYIIKKELNSDQFPIHGIDLHQPSAVPLMLLKGGQGGLGNMHFLTQEIRNPRFSKAGRSAIEGYFIFEMKLIADMALIGLPNAGKSTLLRAISKATPRVGHWEFTTLQPTVGTISLGIDKPSFTVADIPGIIKGARFDKGMGLDFLRHAERSNGLVFVISLEHEDPIASLNTLLNELEDRIYNKKILIIATKADLEDSLPRFKKLKQYVENYGWKIVPCCAKDHQNIKQVVLMMGECAGKL